MSWGRRNPAATEKPILLFFPSFFLFVGIPADVLIMARPKPAEREREQQLLKRNSQNQNSGYGGQVPHFFGKSRMGEVECEEECKMQILPHWHNLVPLDLAQHTHCLSLALPSTTPRISQPGQLIKGRRFMIHQVGCEKWITES